MNLPAREGGRTTTTALLDLCPVSGPVCYEGETRGVADEDSQPSSVIA